MCDLIRRICVLIYPICVFMCLMYVLMPHALHICVLSLSLSLSPPRSFSLSRSLALVLRQGGRLLLGDVPGHAEGAR